jgi:hypothetical protein
MGRARGALREYRAARRLCDRLDKVLVQRMPDPHPSIVWRNPANDADGLKWVADHESPYFKNYIFSRQSRMCLKEPPSRSL